MAKGETTEELALHKIREARMQVARIHQQRDQLEETNPNRCLATRSAAVLTEEIKTPLHMELAASMEKLELFLKEEFRIPA